MYDVGYVVWMIILVIEYGGSVNMDIVYMLRWGRHVLQMAYHVPVWCKALLFIQDILMYNFNTHDYIFVLLVLFVCAIIQETLEGAKKSQWSKCTTDDSVHPLLKISTLPKREELEIGFSKKAQCSFLFKVYIKILSGTSQFWKTTF